MSGEKKNVFSAVLKLSKDGELRTEHDNRFHAAGPNDRVRPSTQELAQSSDKYAAVYLSELW